MDQIEARIRDGQPFRRLAPNADVPLINTDTGIATFIFNNEDVGRDGHVVLNRGIQRENYDRNPTILFAHDDKQPPVGRAAAVRIADQTSKVDIEFTPRDLYPFGALIGDLVRGKYLNACSMSWMPLKWKFSTDRNRAGGVDFLEVDLLEISIVPIPALPGALATARAHGIDTGPLVEWAERLLDTSGQVLVPRQELETLRRAAQMPAPAPRLPKTDEAKTGAAAAADLVDNDQIQERAVKTKRALSRNANPLFKRGLYDAGRLCFLLEELGYAHFSAAFEAEIEGDGSALPAQLKDILDALGKAVIEMTAEEVAEFLAAHGPDEDDVEMRSLKPAERAFIEAAKTPKSRALRSGIAIARAGRTLSNSNQKALEEGDGHHERAMKHHQSLGDHHEAVGGHIKALGEQHERAVSALAEVGEHLRSAQENPGAAADHIGSAVKKQRAATKVLGEVDEERRKLGESHEDLADSHQSLGRCIQRAQRCVRSVLSRAIASDADDESETEDPMDEEAEKAERARKAREARASRARELAKKHREPTTLD